MSGVWKTCRGFTRYEVSENGAIRNSQNKDELSLTPDANGYVRMSIFADDGRRVNKRLHTLVADAFHPNPDRKATVNHINRVRHDNRADNLEWATPAEQGRHRGGVQTNKTRPVWQCHPVTKEKIALHRGAKEAALAVTGKDGIRHKISMVALGKRKKAANFAWVYADNEAMSGGEWKSLHVIPGGSRYKVSTSGRITGPTGQLLRENVTSEGYRACGINKKTYKVHRLVAVAFLENPQSLPCVNHKDGDKRNCSLDNLEWVSCSGNSIHAGSTGLSLHAVRKVEAFDRLTGMSVGAFETITEACSATGQKHRDVVASCRGEHKYSKRMLWQYVDDPRVFEVIEQSSLEGDVLGRYLSVEAAAERAGVRLLSVYPVLNGKRDSTGGFRFRRVQTCLRDIEISICK